MAYQKLNWLNRGETGAIPINKTNLNHMDDGIEQNSNDIANIIESGSNDNGSWVKFSDGTMICRNIFLIKDVTFTELATGINYSETQTITYPQEFIDNDVSVKVSCRSANFAWAVNEISIASSFQFDILHSTNVIRDISCSYIAIGRWK